MTGPRVNDLRQQLTTGNVLVIVGAGVSAGASGGAGVASWTGLLLDGCDRVEEVAAARLPQRWGERIREQIESADLDWMLGAAEDITQRLGGRQSGEYRRWLADSFGKLHARERSVIEALAGLGVPVATTNYDGTIEEVTGWQPVTWRDGAKVQQVLRGDRSAVVHLHGYWDEPESVVLGIRSYDAVLGDAAARSLQRAAMSLRTVVFVGFGAGLGDPNFGALLSWAAAAFPDTAYRHFRLCKDDEVSGVSAQHRPQERVAVLSYGAQHSDLAPFLRSLAGPSPGGAAPASGSGVAHAGMSGSRPGEAALPASSAGLPPAPVCVGRDDLVAEVAEGLLAVPRVPVPVLGGPGIGKTTVCLAALHDSRVAARFGARRWFVRCDGATDAAALVNAIAAELGLVADSGGGPLLTRVKDTLGTGPGVLALDNLDTPWDADTLAVEEVLAALAAVHGVVLAATVRGTRRPIGVPWRHAPAVPPLDLADARMLFIGVAGEEFSADPHLDGLLEAVDRVPLAVELLAYNAQGQPALDGLARRWEQERVALLARAGGQTRQLSVAVSVELSLTSPLLYPDGRRLLTLLGQLPDGIAAADLNALLPREAARAAANLRQLGLIFDDETGRLRVLAPIREHVAANHPPEADDLDRAVTHYCALAAAEGGRVGRAGGADSAERVAVETGNLAQLICVAIDRGNWADIAPAAYGLGEYMRFTGANLPGLWDHILRDMWENAGPGQQARILLAAGTIALDRSNHIAAHRHCQRALTLYRQTGDALGEAASIRRLADIALDRSDYDTAITYYRQALTLYRQTGEVDGEASCIRRLGDIALNHDDYDTARTHYQEALTLHRQARSLRGEANCIQGLGDIAARHGDYDTARTHYQEALTLYRQTGNTLGEASCIQGLGDIALGRSDQDTARARYEEALGIYEQMAVPCSIGLAHRCLARLASGQPRQAHLAAARQAWLSIDRPDLVAELDQEFGPAGD